MSVSPPPERIEVSTPPDSPRIEFHDGGKDHHLSSPQILSAPSLSVVATPHRIIRVVPRRRFKRKRSDSVHTAPNDGDEAKGSDVFEEQSEGTVPESGQITLNVLDGVSTLSNHSDMIIRPSLEIATPNPGGPETGNDGIDPFDHYLDAALADCAGFFQISEKLFVVQGWDIKGRRSTMSWYHLQRVRIGDEFCVACACPHGHQSICLHRRFLHEYQDERFPEDGLFSKADDSVVLFSRQSEGEDDFTNIFSVSTPGHDQLNSRSIVSHRGSDAGTGTWKCSKDRMPAEDCVHLKRARDQLQKLITGIPSARDDSGPEARRDQFPPVAAVRRGGRDDFSVSHLPILPPPWAILPTDAMLYARPPPLDIPPAAIVLNADSKCKCGRVYDPNQPSTEQPCTIYGLLKSYCSRIELQACPLCGGHNRRGISPETRSLGLFNWNGRILVAHDLLDEYTSAYTSSETPFVAWVTTMARRYGVYSEKPFLSEEMFRAVWFSYARLQRLEDDMICPACGPYPETVIWDGVTLAFSRKHLLSTLQPPTTLHVDSPVRNECRYQTNQQLLGDAKLRKLIRNIIVGPSLPGEMVNEYAGQPANEPLDWNGRDDGNEVKKGSRGNDKGQAAVAAIAQIEGIESVCTQLKVVNEGLASLFEAHFGIQAYSMGKKAPCALVELFVQISSEESVLQIANRAALLDLQMFNQNPTTHNASRLVTIPVLYNVLKHVEKDSAKYPKSVISLCRWVHDRVVAVLNRLIVHKSTPCIGFLPEAQDWKTTGCCYSMPQIRHRPKYPRLMHDQRNDSGGSRGAKCSKYYSQYGQQRLTGGIMCAWCCHSVCYGFHCIPRGEGRNDVFSAMITRWPTAPKRVVYDFACALGPYCMTREPDFFADTFFVIDAFHAKGHTKCAPATFLTSYSNIDPRLAHINSSAAECGNSGLSRIRKSVSYMSQERAIQYTKTFLSVWNRQRILKRLAITN